MSKTAAVVSCGPSVNQTYVGRPGPRHDITIAINESADLIPDDGWWCIGDAKAIDLCPQASPKLRLVGPAVQLGQIAKGPSASRLAEFAGVYAIVEGQGGIMTAGLPVFFSLMLAIAFAASLGATSIDVYGADWGGSESFNGKTWGSRDSTRWAIERMLTRSLIRYIRRTMGVDVRRVLPPGAPDPTYAFEMGYSDADLDALRLRVLRPDELEAARVVLRPARAEARRA